VVEELVEVEEMEVFVEMAGVDPTISKHGMDPLD
jgi:hypothetical protein